MTERLSDKRLAEIRKAATQPTRDMFMLSRGDLARLLAELDAVKQEASNAWSDFKVAQQDRDDAEAALARVKEWAESDRVWPADMAGTYKGAGYGMAQDAVLDLLQGNDEGEEA